VSDVWPATRQRVTERQEILRLLLEHRLTLPDVRFFSDPSNGDRSSVLLAVSREYGFGQ
jgi:hypothetical protein